MHTGYDGGAHRIITTNTNTEDDTPDEDPEENLVATEVGRNGDTEDGGHDDDDELFAINEGATELISEETEK